MMSEIISVSDLNRYVQELLSADPRTSSVRVRGEISGFKKYPSGHAYFNLKDQDAQVSCVFFRGYLQNLSFRPEDGQKVVLVARASLYEQDGRFQLVVHTMESDGIGDLYRQFEALKMRLRAEGLFDDIHKKKIPFMPRNIGVISSPKGAVIRDIIHVLSRRFPGFHLLLYPSLVQGQGAAAQIRAGVEYFNSSGKVDVIVLARGGGSVEDLWAFNDEGLARAIFYSSVPVVSAVGHETDFTIADFVADLRAPTPSAAAELVIPEKSALFQSILDNQRALNTAAKHYLLRKKNELHAIQSHRSFVSFPVRFESEHQRLDGLYKRMGHAFFALLASKKSNYSIMIEKLKALNPSSVLDRGYAIVMDTDNQLITDIKHVEKGQMIRIMLKNANLSAEVIAKNSGGKNEFE